MSGGAYAGCSPASCSTSASSKPPIRSCATPPRPTIAITGRNSTSCQAGSRCVIFMMLRRHASIFPISTTNRSIRSYLHAPIIGAAAPPRRWVIPMLRASTTRPPPATSPPITGNSRAPVSVWIGSSSARAQSSEPTGDSSLPEELVDAADILYTLGERDLIVTFVSDVAEQDVDGAVLTALAHLTERHDDARAMLQIGKTALSRGMTLDRYAFPTIGIPQYSPIGPQIDRSVVYSVARTESAFDQHDKSPANAVGLMQVTPEAGRDTAKDLALPMIGTGWSPIPSTIRKWARRN